MKIRVLHWMIVFVVLNPLWPLAFSLAQLSYLIVNSKNLLEARLEGLDARRTSDFIVNNN
jgi:hypothetical protein